MFWKLRNGTCVGRAEDVFGSARGRVAEAEVVVAQTLDGDAIHTHDLGVERLGSGDEPSIVFAQALMGASLQKGAAFGLGQMQALNREALQGGERAGLIRRAFEQLFDTGDRDHEFTPAQAGEKGAGGACSWRQVSRSNAMRRDESSRMTGRALTRPFARGRAPYLRPKLPTRRVRHPSRRGQSAR
jgi:hypothetical protein